MILAKEQINRYLRQIIMPEISGPGQKKLLESSVFICGETVTDIAPAVHYLAATGIGCISCCVDNIRGFDKLLADIHDLNDTVKIELTADSKSDLRIFLGRPEFIIAKDELISTGFVPSVIAISYDWKGGMGIFYEPDITRQFLAMLSATYLPVSGSSASDMVGENLSTCFLGALGALEVTKLALGIGERVTDFLSCNLLTMEFKRINIAALNQLFSEFDPVKSDSCQAVSLQECKVLIAGTGGLGSPVAYALALAGVGTIGLVDYDTVEISNLNRQILHAASRIGMPKTESAAIALKSINPQLTINRYQTLLTNENIFEIIADYDLIVDAVDNFPSRFLLNDACFLIGKPVIEAAVVRFDGTITTIIPQKTSCYRCTIPNIPAPENIPSCSESGVLGPIPGIKGFIQAAEAVKLLSGRGIGLTDRMIFFDGLSSDFLTLKLTKKSTCALCGAEPTIHTLQNYNL